MFDNDNGDFGSNAKEFEKETEAQLSGKRIIRPLSFQTIINKRIEFKWLVKNFLPQESFGVLYGDKGTGKSFYAYDMAMHIAQGRPWRGRKTERCGVLIQVGEGSSGVPKRTQAWVQEFGNPGDLPIAFIDHPVNLLDPKADREALIEAGFEAEKQWGIKLGLFIFDTLARALPGGSDSDGHSMGMFVSNMDYVRQALKCTGLAVHHVGKDASRGPRGHSSLGGAADCMYELQRSDTGLISVRIEKQKEEASGFRDYFRLKRVVIGLDDDQEEISSCVLSEAERYDPRDQVKLKGAPKIAMEALVQCLLDSGEFPTTTSIPRGTRAVSWQKWKEKCFACGISLSNDEAKLNTAFVSAARSLRAAGVIGVANPWVWDCRPRVKMPEARYGTPEPEVNAEEEMEAFERAQEEANVQHSAPKMPQ
jgi:hypothetical protein